jgi:hypothetical protein
MLNCRHVLWVGMLVFAFTIVTRAQDRPPAARPAAWQQLVPALVDAGAAAIAVGDATQARVVYNQLLAIGRDRRRLDLVWQAQHGLGRAALAAHDPLTAIDHLEQSVAAYEQWRATPSAEPPRIGGTPPQGEPYHTLTSALMMQSSSAVDRFVERAFDAASRARADRPEQVRARAELTAAMHAGDMVVAFLVGDSHGYAWAFDRDTLVGYRLPPSAEIATAVALVNDYVARRDRAGVRRISEDLMPALLGPAHDRIPSLTRVIFVMDGPLRQLPIGELPIGEGATTLSQRLAVATVDDGALLDELRRTPSPPQPPPSAWPMIGLTATAAVVALLLVAGVAALRRRSSVA